MNFCGKCGAPLDSTLGLCPLCDREKINEATKNAPKFCPLCGGLIDSSTGLCNNCNPNSNTVENTYQLQPELFGDTKAEPKKNKAVTIIITILLSICLFCSLLIAFFTFGLRNSFNGGNTERLLSNVNLFAVFDNSEIVKEGEKSAFFYLLKEHYSIDFSDSKFNEFLEESTIKDFLADKLTVFSEDFFSGGAVLSFTKDEVVDLIAENSELLEEEANKTLRNSDYEKIAYWLFKGEEFEILNTEVFKYQAPFLYYLIIILLSYASIVFFLVLCLFLIGVMFKKDYLQAFCGIGIVFIIIGAATSLMAVIAMWMPPIWSAICGGSFIGMLLGNFFVVNGYLSLILLSLGIILLVVRSIILKTRRNKAS